MLQYSLQWTWIVFRLTVNGKARSKQLRYVRKRVTTMDESVLGLMQRGAITCTEGQSIREVAQIMVVNRLRYCVVVGSSNDVKGIISARSILMALGRNLARTKARDILLPYTITVTPATPLADAIALMHRKRIEHLIVVSDKPGSQAVLGILSAGDIVQRMARQGKGTQ